MSKIIWETQWIGMAEILTPPQPRQYIVDGLIAKGSLTIVSGLPKSHKTNLVSDMVSCVVAGVPWLGLTTTKTGAVWIDQDSGMSALKERFGSFCRYHGAVAEDRLAVVSYPAPTVDMSDEDFVNNLVHTLLQETGYGLAVFDSLASVSGVVDENSSEMVPVMVGLRRVAEETGLSVLVIHHTTKKDAPTPRGHSSILGAVDLSLHVKRTGDHVTLTPTDCRFMEPEPIETGFRYEHLDGSDMLLQAWFEREPTKKERVQELMDEGVPQATAYRRVRGKT